MKDPVKAIKTAYQTLLTDSVTFSGSNVPVFIMEGDVAQSNYYMVLTDARMNNTPNKHMFNNEVTVTVEVCAKSKQRLTDIFNPVDVMSEQIMELVVPSITTTGLDIGADFQINGVRVDSSNYLPVEDYDSGRLTRRQLIFVHNIIEK